MQALTVVLWRRGRGIKRWRFTYEAGGKSPGFYHKARDYRYKLTIDSHYKNKILWLGRRSGSKWINCEDLYEPIRVVYDNNVIVDNLEPVNPVKVRRRSNKRYYATKRILK